MSVDAGLLVFRLLVGLVVAAHGAQKLFGWWDGPSLKGFTGWMNASGLKPAWLWGWMGALGEFGGGVLLALGLLNPIGPLGVIGAMAMAIMLVHWSKGFWSPKGGYEFPLVLLVSSAVLALVGPGAYSLDAVLGIALPNPLLFWVGIVAVVIVVAYGLSLARQQAAVAQRAAS